MANHRFSSSENMVMCIYTITNKTSGKVYVGRTKNKVLKRWTKHICTAGKLNTHVSRAINKYGEASFIFEVIDLAETEISLNQKELFWIRYFNSLSPNGYNLTTGGFGGVYSEFSKTKMSDSAKGNTNRKGKSVPEESRLRMSLSKIGKQAHPNCKKIVTRNDGRVFSSITEASKEINATRGNIIGQLKGENRLVKGFQFKYGSTQAWTIPSKEEKLTPVLRSDGAVFNSIKDAATAIGAHVSSVYKVLHNKRKSCYGFSFSLIEEVL